MRTANQGSGLIANIGDWVMFTGQGQWVTGRVYIWRGSGWEMLPPPDEINRQNAHYYLIGNSDVTEGAPEAVFSLAQVRSLLASSIFADLIGAKNIILNSDGSIQSEDYEHGVSGFIIYSNGNVEFNNGTFRGHIDATSGTIGGVDINAQSIKVNNKGYLPIGFVYFQLKGQPEPDQLFDGTWQNISDQFAGLFFRVEGGNAAAFGNDQGMAVQSHKHSNGSITERNNTYSLQTNDITINEGTGTNRYALRNENMKSIII